MQADLRNLVLTSQATLASEERLHELPPVPSTSFHHFPQSQPVASTSAYAWHSNNIDLDNMFFDASTFGAAPPVNAHSSTHEDINSIFANWAMPGQSTAGLEGQQAANVAGPSSMTLDIQNDDFMRWLSGDIGNSIGQSLAQSTPETAYHYAPAYEQVNTMGDSSDGTFQFSMSSERAGQQAQQNGRTSPAHPSLQHGIRTRPPSPSLPQQSDQDMQWPMAWEPNRKEHDAGLSTNVMEFGEGEACFPADSYKSLTFAIAQCMAQSTMVQVR